MLVVLACYVGDIDRAGCAKYRLDTAVTPATQGTPGPSYVRRESDATCDRVLVSKVYILNPTSGGRNSPVVELIGHYEM